MPRKLVATSKLASSHGSALMSPTRMSLSGLRKRAMATNRGDASMPLHRAPRMRASSMASPDPHATSSTRSPAPRPRRECTKTYSRQLLGSATVAKSTALRPQPSSTISQLIGPSRRAALRRPRYGWRGMRPTYRGACHRRPTGARYGVTR